MKIFVYLLLAFVLQMTRKCEGGTGSESILECLRASDPMGATYRGTTSQTENGLECQRWDTDEAHTRLETPDDVDNNYCRNPNPDENDSRLPWCYTTVLFPRWEYCSIRTCGHCAGMKYHNKCFLPVAWESVSDRLNEGEAVAECKRRGGSLANLYNQYHMDIIMEYIREQEWFNGYMIFRTGLKIDPKTNIVTLRDGTDAPDRLKWYGSYPWTEATYPYSGTRYADRTNVFLVVDNDPTSDVQYLMNPIPTWKTNVLCEME